ncbi:MAG: hypothetical protein IK990_03740, partial [Ruminiclostridium sp.]|nr:hypothetical protein [Ruminiclostridium sp.]
MGIKTKIERQERDIHSQNRVVNNYAVQLRSNVISDGHRKAILKELQLEMTAEQYRQPLRRVYKHNAIRSYDNDVEYGDNYEKEIPLKFNPIQTGGEAVQSVRNKVDHNYIHSARSNGYIHTAQLRFTVEAKKVVDEARAAETRYNEELRKQRLKMVVSSETKKQERRKSEVKRRDEKRKEDKSRNKPIADLKNQKFAVPKADSDDSVAIEAVQTVTASVATAGQ